MADRETIEKLTELFKQFAAEEKGVSSFAISSLLNRTIAIIEAMEAQNPD